MYIERMVAAATANGAASSLRRRIVVLAIVPMSLWPWADGTDHANPRPASAVRHPATPSFSILDGRAYNRETRRHHFEESLSTVVKVHSIPFPLAGRSSSDVPPLAGPARPAIGGRLWMLAAPLRAYIRHFPVHRGKGFVTRHVLMPLLPPEPAAFITHLPGGAAVELRARETLGFATLLNGGFETAEIECAIELAAAGTTAFDVGANVGVYTVAIARAVDNGRVVAVEPDAATMRRLRANLGRNSLDNVLVIEAVASECDGTAELHVADDPAYSSTGEIEVGHRSVGSRVVASVRLDTVWADLGRPGVSMVKIDVEGAEVAVLRGARAMLISEHPSLLVEANNRERLGMLAAELGPLGYRESPQRDFAPWNHLFVWSGES